MPEKQRRPAAPTPDRKAPTAHDLTSLAGDEQAVDDQDVYEALAQARARWGERGIVHVAVTIDGEGRREVVRLVGRQHDPFAWAVLGQGPTWREAFAQADGVVRRAE